MTAPTQSNPSIARAAVVGSGYMGGGIAQVMAMAGVRVDLLDQSVDVAEKSRLRILDEVTLQEDAGYWPAGTRSKLESLISAAPSFEEAVHSADYITEAVSEDPAIKLDILRRVSEAARPDTIIASNTSALPIGLLAESVVHPERFLGVHWMNPAPLIPGVEIISTPQTDPLVAQKVIDFLLSCGKTPTRVSDSPGFVANRLQFALYKECMTMLETGVASASEIDAVVSSTFGFRLALFGPFTIGDMAGLDVCDAIYTTLEAAYGERFTSPLALRKLVDAHELGLKSGGAGVYDLTAQDIAALVKYREAAYFALSKAKGELGAPPTLTPRNLDR